MKLYVASSWRNHFQEIVVRSLRANGHEVYDFKNPGEGKRGFAWSEIDPKWQEWDAREFTKALSNPVALAGFDSDMTALRNCDACVLVMPSGRSAHLEAGWASGAGKKVVVLLDDVSWPTPGHVFGGKHCDQCGEILIASPRGPSLRCREELRRRQAREPELMYLMHDAIALDLSELGAVLSRFDHFNGGTECGRLFDDAKPCAWTGGLCPIHDARHISGGDAFKKALDDCERRQCAEEQSS